MSNKVYGFCDAGCRYRVTPYDEFLKSAAYVPLVPNEQGEYELEIGRKYKIFDTTANGTAFDNVKVKLYERGGGRDILAVVLNTIQVNSTGFIKPKNKYADSFIFVPHSVTWDESKFCYACTSDDNFVESYEYFGDESILYYEEDLLFKFIVTGASRVVQINEEAEIEGKEGKSAYEVALENGFEGTEAEWLASLKGATVTLSNDGNGNVVITANCGTANFVDYGNGNIKLEVL